MKKELTLIHPDIDHGGGRTREIIDDLSASFKNGRNSGAGEIAAVVDFMSGPDNLPDVYRFTKGGVFEKFGLEFLSFLHDSPPKLPAFVEKIKKKEGWSAIPTGIACFASATGALFCALQTARVAGGEVVTSSFNYAGVVNAIMMAGGIPRFVDVDARAWCMDPKLAARAVNKNTRAMILTHLNRFADIEPYINLFNKQGYAFPLIQDASLAIGSTLHGLRPGLINIGLNGVTVFSLTISKILSGLGGAVAVSHDMNTLNQMYEIAHQGVSASDPSIIGAFGANFKMSALNAVIAMEQLKRRDEIFARRRRLMDLYLKRLASLTERGKIKLQDIGAETVVTHLPILLKCKRGPVSVKLSENFGIQTGLWWAHHSQPLYRMLHGRKKTVLPRADKLAGRLVFLPFHTKLSDEDVSYICEALGRCL